MRRLLAFPVFCWLMAGPVQAARETIPFDLNWRFAKGEVAGASGARFDDASWERVDTPHDWSIYGPFDPKAPAGGAGAFLPAGVGWYRKHFTLREDPRRRVFVEFDGVMANSEVWINGFRLGKRPYGYVSFAYELTGHVLLDGRENVLAVRADDEAQPASRWYAGAGIYRHVRLIALEPVHLQHWSTFITTPRIGPTAATVRIRTSVVNQDAVARSFSVELELFAPNGQRVIDRETVPATLGTSSSAEATRDLEVPRPQLWDVDHPAQYRLVTRVKAGAKVLDEQETLFGIREFHFDAPTGFWLNGRNFKLKGACLHEDGGAVGIAVPASVWEHRLRALKAIGVNAIRTAHNPPAPEFLDACDRLGMLVMDEMFDCWTVGKNPYDYHLYFRDWSQQDTRDTALRDRNHPSIVLYSAGNEIRDTPQQEFAKKILRGLVEVFHTYDPTRPVTQALFRPNVSHDYEDGLADMLDVLGQNYRENELLAAHREKPARKILGTENGQDRKAWLALRDNPPFAGEFLWSAVDYLGESRFWPLVGNPSGLLDRTGAIKPIGYERMSWWSDKPMVYIARRMAARVAAATDPGYENAAQQQQQRRAVETLDPDWTPANLSAHQENVEVYSNCGEVELLLNGRSLGAKALPSDAAPRIWQVGFEAGKLEAIGRDKGREVARAGLRTASKPARIELETDRQTLASDWESVAFVTARVVDENGVTVPTADNAIAFQTQSPGYILATDNGDLTSHEPFQSRERHAFQGRAVALVVARGAGKIAVTALAEGLASGSITIMGER
ncbi:MAG: glycoside hydrolase family 2 TIM barrel-domain containing protein [Bryobacteraceae bacterium]